MHDYDCGNCRGTGECPACEGDGDPCSWCRDGACADCGGTGTDPYLCEEID